MDWKQFLKPDWRKIVLTLVEIILVSMIENCIFGCVWCGGNYGLPFVFFCSFMGTGPFAFMQITDFFVRPFIVDTLFWYLISCLIIWIYDKFKKKSS